VRGEKGEVRGEKGEVRGEKGAGMRNNDSYGENPGEPEKYKITSL
jgi:hypothetical protein